ncbi:LamG-like jellyroll fold domain-containing protein [Streptomyces mirabilis]|uniref:LamG-like jellyroll fold domain-containing protein n=1 Tax=Streptomyces mirabilis TaxID=68239 RepID=UPI00364AF440
MHIYGGGRRARARSRGILAGLALLGISAAGLTPVYAATPRGKAPEVSGTAEHMTRGRADGRHLTPLPSGFGLTAADQSAMRAAAAKARASRHAVVVDELTSPTEQVVAEPSGRFALAANPQPVRVRHGGGWTRVDLTLRRQADGTWAPAATAYGRVAFSPGGSGPLAVTRSGGVSLKLTWPGVLPAPVVSGATATYRSVLPSVDLVMSPTAAGGLSDILVIHSAKAAENPELASLRLGTAVHGGRLESGPDGGLQVADSEGRVVADAPTPLQWDSNKALPAAAHRSRAKVAADASDIAHAGLAARVAPVRASVSRSALTLVPDARMLRSASTVWPVYVDPSVNWHPVDYQKPAFDEVKQGCPGNSFYNQTGGLADNGYLGVGYNGWPEGYCYTGDEHAIYQWKLSKTIWGAHIDSAEVDATDVYSASCSTTATVNLHWSNGIGSGTDWSNRPRYNKYSTSKSFGPAYNHDFCPSNGSVTNGFDVKTPMVSAAKGHWSTFTATLSEDSMEASHDDLGFKRFSNNPTLQIFFNNAPNVPTASTMAAVSGADDAACATSGAGPYMGKTIAATPPVLRAKVSDPNGDKLQATFQYWVSGSTTKKTGLSGDNLASGTLAKYTLPASFISSLTSGQTVDWQVQVSDGMDSTTYTQSPTCRFTAEPTAPDTPTVVSENNLYPDTDDNDSVVGAAAGTAGKFDVASAGTAAVKFVARLDVSPATSNPPGDEVTTTTNSAATITVTPPSPGPHTLYVYAVDKAGDVSGAFAYPFLAAGHGASTCASFTVCLNNTAISPDATMTEGNADGSGHSMSATDLTNAGWSTGGPVTVDGATFALPAFGSGQKDNVLAANQTITFGGSGNALVFLANSTNAGLADPGAIAGDSTAPYVPAGTAVSGSYCFDGTTPLGVCPATGTIAYTDGTATSYDLTVPDWISGPSASAAFALPHWNSTSSQITEAAGAGPKIYAFSVPIDPAKTVASVTLPDVTQQVGNSTQGLHIYGIATRDTAHRTVETNGSAAQTTATLPSGQSWTGAWANPNEGDYDFGGGSFSNQSIRVALKPSLSGGTVRVKLDNALGSSKLSIGHATIALSSNATSPSAVPSGAPKGLTFDGKQAVTVPEGGVVYSDPLPFTVTAGQFLLVSYQLSNTVPYLVQHSYANGSYEYITATGAGDQTTDTTGTPYLATGSKNGNFTDLVTDLDVASANVPTEAVLGDNLTDPFQPGTTLPNSNGYRVSDALAAAEPSTQSPYGVLAEGIEANQLMDDNPETYNGNPIGGPSALSRLDRDILDQPGINTVVVTEGLEDLLNGPTTDTDLESDGYTALVQQLQAWGVNVVLTSLTPCDGFTGDNATPNDPCTSTVDDYRTDVNAFLGGMNLGSPWGSPAVYFADFDSAVAVPDTANGEEKLAPAADGGDHVNLSNAAFGSLASALLSPLDEWDLTDGNSMPVATDTAATDGADQVLTPIAISNPNTGNSPLTLAGGSSWGSDGTRGTVLSLDGSSGYAASGGQVLDTTASYSVSAWVKPSSLPSGNATVAEQDGDQNSPFYLQYNYAHKSSPGWALTFTNGDTASASFTLAYASGATANAWTHLVGVYNAATKVAQLYVNGTLAGTASNVTSWSATNAFSVGRSKYNGANSDFFPGSISDVQAWNYALTPNQVTALYKQIP